MIHVVTVYIHIIAYIRIFVYVYTYTCVYKFGKDDFCALTYGTNELKPFHFLHFSNPAKNKSKNKKHIGSNNCCHYKTLVFIM